MYFSISVIVLKVPRQQIIKKRESINTSNLNCQLNFLVSNMSYGKHHGQVVRTFILVRKVMGLIPCMASKIFS